MPKNDFCYLYLTCDNTVEAGKISDVLLAKNLIVCAKQMSTDSYFHWKGKIAHEGEVLIIMESRLSLFEEVEKEVASLHSYETFVLEALPVLKVSKGATKWMNDNIRGGKE